MLGVGIGVTAIQQSPYALPTNNAEPLIVLDFKNGVYQANGSSVTIDDLLTENPDYGAWDGASAVTSGVGLVGGGGGGSPGTPQAPVFTGAASDLVLAGATTVTTFVWGGSNNNNYLRYELLSDVDYTTFYGSYWQPEGAIGATNGLSDNANSTSDVQCAAGTHTGALTMIEGRMARSTDGAEIIVQDPADPWTPAPTFLALGVPVDWVVERVAIYPAQPDADLPTLSTP